MHLALRGASVLARFGTRTGDRQAESGDVDFDLTERQSFFRDRVRDFIDAHVRPRVADYQQQIATRATAGSRSS